MPVSWMSTRANSRAGSALLTLLALSLACGASRQLKDITVLHDDPREVQKWATVSTIEFCYLAEGVGALGTLSPADQAAVLKIAAEATRRQRVRAIFDPASCASPVAQGRVRLWIIPVGTKAQTLTLHRQSSSGRWVSSSRDVNYEYFELVWYLTGDAKQDHRISVPIRTNSSVAEYWAHPQKRQNLFRILGRGIGTKSALYFRRLKKRAAGDS